MRSQLRAKAVAKNRPSVRTTLVPDSISTVSAFNRARLVRLYSQSIPFCGRALNLELGVIADRLHHLTDRIDDDVRSVYDGEMPTLPRNDLLAVFRE